MNEFKYQIFISILSLIFGLTFIKSHSPFESAEFLTLVNSQMVTQTVDNYQKNKKQAFNLKMSPIPLVTFVLTPMPLVTNVNFGSQAFVPSILSPTLALSPVPKSIFVTMAPDANNLVSPINTYLIGPSVIVVPVSSVSLSPAPTVVVSLAVSPILSPTMSPLPSATEVSPSVSVIVSVSPTGEVPIGNIEIKVVINEIGWMGTPFSPTDEWVELYNPSASSVNIEGWVLKSNDGSPNIVLKGIITGGGYYLIERTDDKTISDIAADLVSSFGRGGLNNDGESLSLIDKNGVLIDFVDCESDGWYAGDNTAKLSMERISAATAGNIKSNWASNKRAGTTGKDGAGNTVQATPRQKNSITI